MNRWFIATLFVAATGCVTTGTFDKKVAELQAETAEHDRLAAEKLAAEQAARKEEVEALKAKLAATEADLAASQQQAQSLTNDLSDTRKNLDEQTAVLSELKKRLEKLGQNVDRLMSEKGQLNKTLVDAKERLEELRKQREAAEARVATFKRLVERFRSMIDSGQLNVIVRNGRMLISLPDAVLFDSGKTAIKPGGLEALNKVAEVLGSITDRQFVVAGHTDDVPIKTARFPSNWELSTARAVEVVNYLVKQGMQPQTLSAAGFSQYDPVAPNDTPENKALNRRIEIVLQPNLAELPSLEGLAGK